MIDFDTREHFEQLAKRGLVRLGMKLPQQAIATEAEAHQSTAISNDDREYEQPAEPRFGAGDEVRFFYPSVYSSKTEEEKAYHAHSGQIVRITRQKTWDDEYENLGDPLYEIVADDGWHGEAWESELMPAYMSDAEAEAWAAQRGEHLILISRDGMIRVFEFSPGAPDMPDCRERFGV